MPPEIEAYSKVLPLVGLSDPDRPKASEVLGTAFVVTDGVLVTCWHVVRDAIEKNWAIIAAWDQRGDGKFTRIDVTDIARHPAGDDLATARVDLPGAGWRIPARELVLDLGTNVVSMGYPLPDVRLDPDGALTHIVSFRFLKGYLTHIPIIERAGYPPAPSFELDMPAPRGISGGPLLHADWSNVLIGVVYGTNAVERIETFASVDPETGDRTPEVLETVSFALAHTTRTLRSLSGPATGDRPLGVVMSERGEVFER
jgi:hypothetical protein